MKFPSFNIDKNGFLRSYLDSKVHKHGIKYLKEGFGIAGSKFSRYLGLGFLGFSIIKGFREGGMAGAAKETVKYGIGQYLFGTVVKSAGLAAPTALPAVAAVLSPYALYKGRQFAARVGRETYGKHTRVEMGTPIIDQFGNIATMRQRSLQALQNSRLNGMTALGNEATMMYRPYFR